MTWSTRRAILITAGFLTFLVLMFHFPFEGYRTQLTSGGYIEIECPSGSIRTNCGIHAPLAITALPFSMWTSLGALFDWAAPVKNALVSIVIIWAAAAAVLLTIRTRK